MSGFKRLTFGGVNDLYQTPFGAHTLKDYEELKKKRKEFRSKTTSKICNIPVSEEMSIRNERLVDAYKASIRLQ